MSMATWSKESKGGEMNTVLFKPLCKKCGNNPCTTRGRLADGVRPKYKSVCSSCKSNSNRKRIYRSYVKNKCDLCGFMAINKCQIDIDHIDGNHNNDSKENLQSLCANCHRLKTFLNKNSSPLPRYNLLL